MNCPNCNSIRHKHIHLENGVYQIVKCLECDLMYVKNPKENPEKIYWGEEQVYLNEARLIFEGKAKCHRDPNYLEDLKIIRKYKPQGKLLDIGCNMGLFLRLAKRYYDCQGLEPSPALANIAREEFKLGVKNSFLQSDSFLPKSFDVITLIDTLEHILGPRWMLSNIHTILKNDGILYIKVPNGLYNLLKLKFTWEGNIFDACEHIVHYTADTLADMLIACGYRIIDMKIGRPIQVPVWQEYVGNFYQYPTPFILDPIRQGTRTLLYWLSLVELWIGNTIGYFAPNIIVVARKEVATADDNHTKRIRND